MNRLSEAFRPPFVCHTFCWGTILWISLSIFGAPAYSAGLDTIPLISPVTGDRTSLAAHTGHILLVNFWAPWCLPCLEEFPKLQALQVKLRDTGLVVVGVTAEADTAKIAFFVKKTGVTFPILQDRYSVLHSNGQVGVMPTTLLLDPQGRVVRTYEGFNGAKGLTQMEKDVLALGARKS